VVKRALFAKTFKVLKTLKVWLWMLIKAGLWGLVGTSCKLAPAGAANCYSTEVMKLLLERGADS